ncbi:cuticle protein 16.8 [Trichonephila clavata]|uniref:Cuticle protein 16.8 n=1 Tax=Trichonephila clavata TaxID=2740835 RepID=A0A8X6LLI2_TRICU|nr:cuticle protein 16.8 [Trichonephila clavata]
MFIISFYTFAVSLFLITIPSWTLTIPPRYVRIIKFPAFLDRDYSMDYPKPYEFGYSLRDDYGTKQHRKEVANEDGVVTGSYGYLDPEGVYRFVDYIADKDGYRAKLRTIRLVASAIPQANTKPNVMQISAVDNNSSSSETDANELIPININKTEPNLVVLNRK